MRINKTDMTSQEKNKKDSKINNNTNNNEPEVLEQGDIYFFYRPKKNSQDVKDIDDIRRFFMVTAPEGKNDGNSNSSNDKNQFYRLFVIGKKSLPEIRTSEARASERYWARVEESLKVRTSLQKNYFQMNLEKVMVHDRQD